MHVCKTLSQTNDQGLQTCLVWTDYISPVDQLYSLLSAIAITGTQASVICCGLAAVHIVAYLMKQSRRAVK